MNTSIDDFRHARFRRRKRLNYFALTLSLLAMAFGMMWLIWILYSVLQMGAQGLSMTLFTEMTPPPDEQGGLLNAIYGSVLMTVITSYSIHYTKLYDKSATNASDNSLNPDLPARRRCQTCS